MIKDLTQREQALDPTQSFIVQAPAGSGKTELLTQRYLRLLATVDKYPEEIIAITFTRKAANEMRNRIINALQRAANESEPDSTHSKRTWQLAQQALQRSHNLCWDLLQNPNRLRIQTIDSFCGYLSEQMPVLAHLGGNLNRLEDASGVYANAVDNLLTHLESKHVVSTALTTLLTHLDNNLLQVKELLCAMLTHREQWLPYILHARQQDDLRQQLEQTLQNIINEHLQKLMPHFPIIQQDEILTLLRFATSILNEENPHHKFSIWNIKNSFPEAHFSQLSLWHSLSELFLTQEGAWRRMVDKRLGFPTEANSKEEKLLFKDYKNRMLSLIGLLNTNEELRQLLAEIRTLPQPHYPETQWQVLVALCELLPYLVAELHLEFQNKGQVDFVEIGQRALQALGELEKPSDLALCLDYRIKHLLVDEFQDTSVSQFRLLEMLTRGWQLDDGRTLFLVGDPMQSIYRFRAAEVGIFLQTQKYGIGQIKLTPLTLATNFRSQQAIVEWINTTFSQIFPYQEDIALGAIGYAPAIANYPANSKQAVFLHNTPDEILEAKTIIEIIRHTRVQHPDFSIAILVKARNHLTYLLPALTAAEINYQAVDVEPLLQFSYIQDLTALTRALLHLNDRIAWLSILRAPWCGLTLTDLHVLARDDSKTLWQCIFDPALQHKLSDDGRQRLQNFIVVVQPYITQVGRTSLTKIIKQLWLELWAPATLTSTEQLKNSEMFFNLLTEMEQDESIIDTVLLEQKLASLYTECEPTPNAIQLMTIHKAKGLEFDVVILPSLDTATVHDKDKLLLWQEHPSIDGKIELLLTPIKAKDQDTDAIYQYIKQFDRQKQAYERARLFYVATTRAKHELHLIATLPEPEKLPTADSFLHKIYELHKDNFKQYYEFENATISRITKHSGDLWRLPLNLLRGGDLPATLPNSLPESARASSRSPLQYGTAGNQPLWQSPTPRLLGTVIHLLLQRLSQIDHAQWSHLIKNTVTWRILLLQAGINHADVDNALAIIGKLGEILMKSSHARWLLNKNHQDARSEYAISIRSNNEWHNYIIDRTFIEHGTRWVIDYKTSQPFEEQTIEDFLAQEKLTYQQQLETYANAFSEHPESVKLALYFPLINELIVWVYSVDLCKR